MGREIFNNRLLFSGIFVGGQGFDGGRQSRGGDPPLGKTLGALPPVAESQLDFIDKFSVS